MFRHSSKFRSLFRVHIKLPACTYSVFTTFSVFRSGGGGGGVFRGGTLGEEELDRKMGDSWHWERQKLGLAKKLSSFLRSNRFTG